MAAQMVYNSLYSIENRNKDVFQVANYNFLDMYQAGENHRKVSLCDDVVENTKLKNVCI